MSREFDIDHDYRRALTADLDATLAALDEDSTRDQQDIIAAFAESQAVASLLRGAAVVPLPQALSVAAAMGYIMARNVAQAKELKALLGASGEIREKLR